MKYIQDEHGEKRRKNGFSKGTVFSWIFMYVSAYMDRKFKTEEGKLRLMELSSKTWSAAFRKEPKYIVVQDTFNLVRIESEVS